MKHANRLRRLPYFRELMSKDDKDRGRFLSESCPVGDVDLEVVELHGEPGDVFLVDMRVLHTGAPKGACPTQGAGDPTCANIAPYSSANLGRSTMSRL